MKFEVFARFEDYADRLSLYVFSEGPNGSRALCTNLDKMEFTDYTPGKFIANPTIEMSGSVARPLLQAIVDEAKKHGIAATGSPVLENELTATKYHLEDMRTLVFKDSR